MKEEPDKSRPCGKTNPTVPKRRFNLAYPAPVAKREHPWQIEVAPDKSRSPK